MTGCGCSQDNCAHEFDSLLRKRKEIASRRPKFRRSESNRFPRLGDKWRSSKGIRSKMRLKKKGRWPIVETGYRGPRLTRGLNPKGRIEVLVHTPEDVEFIDPYMMAIRIAASVGKRKRAEIIKKAGEFGVEIVNLRPDEKPKEAKAEEKAEEEPSEETVASKASDNDQEGSKE
ncbi:MAG: 50S ribosomal protein L32e [Candidatus Methanosuratincola petrocarbonis]|nr:50S ribosomal protein L32e [Candidatus Methanosuratincola sp.]